MKTNRNGYFYDHTERYKRSLGRLRQQKDDKSIL